MARIDNYYPASPLDVPEDLTEPSSDYQTRMILVFFSLLTFFGLYISMLVSSAILIPLSLLIIPPPFSFPFVAFFFVVFLFLVKGFFKSQQQQEKSFRLEIFEEEHPKLFAFINKLCDETGAPLPHRVFITPEVNAAVFYNDSVLSLILPTPKNLLIGMGLVNVLTLSEFKAVLAHEFGHFSQKSMKLHRYVYSANRIIGDMVFGRDWLDRFVLGMCSKSGCIVALGYLFWGMMSVFRKLLEWAFIGINFLSLSLSRQMEFNADLVAVSVTGSDAIVHALSRLDFATQTLGQAFEDLRVASHHDLYTADLFYHQNHAAGYLRRVRKAPHLGEPPTLPDDPECSPEVFEAEDEGTPEMWSTHPSCYDREQNAKALYIRCDLDERSPWILFDDPQGLRERLSRKFYRNVIGLPKDIDLDDPSVVQQFIDDEHAETTYDPRYQGAYDGRLIKPGKIEELETAVRKQPWKPEVLIRIHSRLYGDELKARMKDNKRLREEQDQLLALKHGENRPEDETFRFRGRRYDLGDVNKLLKQVQRELDEDYDWLAEMDGRVFRVFYQMARDLGKPLAKDLLYRYEFHLAVQAIDRDVSTQKPPIEAALSFISNSKEAPTYEQFKELRTIFRDAHDALVRSITLADKMKLPKLKNLEEGQPLGEFLLERQVIKGLRPTAQTLTIKWISKFLRQIGEVQDRIRRIHWKSLGALLALQEDIGKRWLAEHGGGEEILVVEEAPEPESRPRQKKSS